MKLINPTRPAPVSLARQRGTQILEFALVLPLLLFCAFVVIESASYVRMHQVINNAAREGAHFAAMPGNRSNLATVQTVVKTYAKNNYPSLDTNKVTVSVNAAGTALTSTGITLNTSKVVVTYSYPLKYLPAVSFLPAITCVDANGTTLANPCVTLMGNAVFENFE